MLNAENRINKLTVYNVFISKLLCIEFFHGIGFKVKISTAFVKSLKLQSRRHYSIVGMYGGLFVLLIQCRNCGKASDAVGYG